MTVISAITETKVESLRLDRYRDEQADKLLDIKYDRVNTDGLLTLRRLAAAMPDLEYEEYDLRYLSPNRAVNVFKACRNWAGSFDFNISKEVEGVMVLIFILLTPVLQITPGSHWESIWDITESNIVVRALSAAEI